jgi:CHAD domain-containing protein
MSKKVHKNKKVTLELRSRESFSVGIKRILIHLHHDAARLITSKSRIHLSVHEVRTHIKKIRGILRLIRHEIGEEQYKTLNSFYRELGSEVAPVRDDTSQIELLQGMSKKIKSEALRKSIIKSVDKISIKRKAHFADFMAEDKDQIIRQKFLDQVTVIENLDIEGNPKIIIKKSLKKIYQEARSSMYASLKSRSNEDYHNWRKQAKYLTYHMMLLRKAWPSYFKTYSDEMGKLSAILGEIHDLFLFRDHLREGALSGLDKELKKLLQRKIYKTHKLLFKRAQLLGAKIFGESGNRFADLLYTLWTSDPAFK